ncbi:MAG TPA: class I SAM-dependent methyltransferase [Acidimicrobiales bacterium]|nr:class I SAM-dependent methyltransferase [Acidimicrobiales bacterium]
MSGGGPAFAEDPSTQRYYDQRAGEYDEWYLGEGLFAERDRPGWHEELQRLERLLEALEPGTTLDVACGTAFLSRHLPGGVLGLDRSPAMVSIARGRLGRAAVADALALPVAAGSVTRVFTAHFYGHLPPEERARFLAEVRQVAVELVVVDTATRPGCPAEMVQERVLNDGSRHRVFKRFLSAGQLADEIGGSALFDGRWFVAAQTRFDGVPRR